MESIPAIFLRSEPADKYECSNREVLRLGYKLGRDVKAYSDPEATTHVATWPWHYDSKPDKRNKSVMLNCIRRPVVWLPDSDDTITPREAAILDRIAADAGIESEREQ